MVQRILKLEAELVTLQKELDEAVEEREKLNTKIQYILAKTKDAEDELVWCYKFNNEENGKGNDKTSL